MLPPKKRSSTQVIRCQNKYAGCVSVCVHPQKVPPALQAHKDGWVLSNVTIPRYKKILGCVCCFLTKGLLVIFLAIGFGGHNSSSGHLWSFPATDAKCKVLCSFLLSAGGFGGAGCIFSGSRYLFLLRDLQNKI